MARVHEQLSTLLPKLLVMKVSCLSLLFFVLIGAEDPTAILASWLYSIWFC